MIFDASTLQRSPSLNKLTTTAKLFDAVKLKEWWTRLSQEEQSLICTIDTPDIISNFANTTNTALLLFKLYQQYKNKGFISVQRHRDQSNTIMSSLYEFKLVEDKIVHKDLAELFSCYHLFLDTSSNQKTSSNTSTNPGKSYIKVKNECLASILDHFTTAIAGFAQGKKTIFPKEHEATLYSFFTKTAFLKVSFPEVESSSIQEFFYKLLAVTLILENNVYHYYAQKTRSQTLSRLVNSSRLFHSQAITPPNNSEMETAKASTMGKSPSPALSAESSTTDTCDSNSKKLVSKNVQPFWPSDETFKTGLGNLGGQENVLVLNGLETAMNTEVAEEDDKGSQGKYNDINIMQLSSRGESNESKGFYMGYEGFLIENLEISFHMEDEYLEIVSDEEGENTETASLLSNEIITEDFTEYGESEYGYRRPYRKSRTGKDNHQAQQNMDAVQENEEEVYEENDGWRGKGKTSGRYGKQYRAKDSNWETYYVEKKSEDLKVSKTSNSDERVESPEEWDEENDYYSSPRGHRRDGEYKESGRRWRGKGRHEVVYCLKEKNQKEENLSGRRRNGERYEKNRFERVK